MLRTFLKGLTRSSNFSIFSLGVQNFGLLNNYKLSQFQNASNLNFNFNCNFNFYFYPKKKISTLNQKAIFYESKNEKDLEAMLTTNLPVIFEFYSKSISACAMIEEYIQKLNLNIPVKIIKFELEKYIEIANKIGIKLVPTFCLYYNNTIVDRVEGSLSDNRLEMFFRTVEHFYNTVTIQKRFDEFILQIEQTISKGNYRQALKEIETQKEYLDKFPQFIYFYQAYIYYLLQEIDSTKAYIEKLRKEKLIDKLNDNLMKRIAEIELKLKIESERKSVVVDKELEKLLQLKKLNSKDLENRYQIAIFLFKKQRTQEAIEECLEIIKIDKKWNNQEAKNFLLKIFASLGNDNLLAIEGRKKLMKILY